MTTQSASARPYSVFVEVPRFIGGLIAVQDSDTYVDKSVGPGQLDAYTADESRSKTIVACGLASVLPWAFPITFGIAFLALALESRNLGFLDVVIGLFLVWVTAVVAANIYIGRRQKSFTETTKRLAGHLVPVPAGKKRDLWRIQNALQTLQADHGPAFDEQAREALAAVLVQDRHRPCEKHLVIADSTAVDPDSVAIRTRALASKAAWGADVARAEHLILVLEATAEQKVPAAA